MKRWNVASYLILGCASAASLVCFATSDTTKINQTDKTDKAGAKTSEQHDAHVHGTAKLMLAMGGNGLEIMLETPATNILGFEHTPSSDDERKRVADARHQLESGAQLFEMNTEAGCSLLSANVSSSLFEDKSGDGSSSELPQTANTEHRDIDASWSFSCAKPEALKSVSTHLFSSFTGIKQLGAEWITKSGGSALQMDKDATITLTE